MFSGEAESSTSSPSKSDLLPFTVGGGGVAGGVDFLHPIIPECSKGSMDSNL